MSQLKKFFIHYSHFVAGNVSSLLLGLISFPILTRVLTREEYGIMSLVTTTILFTVAIAKGGLSDGIIRFYKEYSETPEKLTIFSSTVAIRGTLLSLLVVLLYISIFSVVNTYLNIKDEYIPYFMIMAPYLFIRPLNIIALNILRVMGKTIFYNLIAFIGKMASIVFSILLLIYLIGEFYGYFIGLVIAELIVAVVLFYWFMSNYKIALNKVSGSLALNLAKFGIPLLITELSYLLLSFVDRYMIVAYQGENVLGLYSVGYNLAMYLSNTIMFSLSYAIVPIYIGIYEKEGREKTEEFLQKSMYYMLIAIIPMWIGYFAISKDLFTTLASQKYEAASSFSPIILLGLFLLGLNNIFNAGLYLKKKSMTILSIMLLAVVINVVINILLLPKYGVIGAAIATLVACLAATILTIFLSFRHIYISIDIKTAIFYTVLSGIMYLVVKQIVILPAWVGLIVKIIIGVLIIVPAVLFKEREILTKIKVFFAEKSLFVIKQ